jgi:uridylate kinase
LRQPKHPRPKTIPVTEEDHVKQVAQELYDKLKQGMKVKVVIGVGKPNG